MPLCRLRFPALYVALILLLVSGLQACAQELEKPTSQDRVLAHNYTSLVAQLLAADSPARELINERSPERVQTYLDALNSQTEVDPWLLRRARRYTQRVLLQLEEIKALAPPATYTVKQSQEAITLDGKLTEAAWKTAPAMPVQYNRLEKREGTPATVRLLWDEVYLYAAFEVPDTNIIAPAMKRDGEIWTTDCVELFLVPDLKARDYWEIEISARGDIYDGLCHKYTDQWGSQMQVEKSMEGLQFAIDLRGTLDKTDDRDEGYTIEIAIPFKELPNFPSNPKIGDQLYALLCRVERDNPDMNAKTTPLAQVPWISWFHNIWAFQPLILSAPGQRTPAGQ
jgi:hypothetical protein